MKGLRWSQEEYSAHAERLAGKTPPAQRKKKPADEPMSVSRQTGQQKLQALGRMKKGKQNATEAKYDRHLAEQHFSGVVAWYAFEKVKLMLGENTSITVDFFVMYADGRLEAHDVKGSKGVFTDDARAKMKIAAAMFPWPFKAVYPSKGGGWDVEEF